MDDGFALLRPLPSSDAFRPVYRAPEPEMPVEPAPVFEAEPVVEDTGPSIEELLAEARAQGYGAGLDAGRQAAEAMGQERIAMALEGLTVALDLARVEAEHAAAAAARDLAALIPAALESVLPGLGTACAPALLARLAEELRPKLSLLPGPRLLVAPGLAHIVEPLLAGLSVTLAEDAEIAEGDARLHWEGGSLRFDRSTRLAALQEALTQAGMMMTED